MRRISCGRAEQLMPLYAAGDLPAGRRARAAAVHVASCAGCARLAEEFRASREWAREAGAAPEFGAGFYEQLRAGVLAQINSDTRPAAPGRFAPLLGVLLFARPPFSGRRLAYAASLAACAVALALYLGHDTAGPRPSEVAVAPPAGELISVPPRGVSAPPRLPAARLQEGRPRDVIRRGAAPTERPKGDSAGGSFKRTPTLRRVETPAGTQQSPEMVAAAAADPATRIALVPAATRDVAPAVPAAEAAHVSRIEIQTADPNIRIIWFAQVAVEDAEPGEYEPDR